MHQLILINLFALCSALVPLAQLFSQNYIFSQYVNLNRPTESLATFHKDYLDHDLNKLGVFLDLNCRQSSLITNQVSHWLHLSYYIFNSMIFL